MSDAWLVPMTIGLCLDMCAIFLLAKSFGTEGDGDNIDFGLLDFAVLSSKTNFHNANKMLNDEKIKTIPGFDQKWAYNEITRIDLNFHILNEKYHKFNQAFFADKHRKVKDNISNLIIVVFGISLMILGALLVPPPTC